MIMVSAGTATTGTAATGTAGRRALIGLICAVSMTTIDQTIVALSAPTIQGELGLTHDEMQWAVNAYLLATAAFFLLGGRLADVLGHKRMVLIGIAGFGVTSLLCGLVPVGDGAGGLLIAARALQGVSGALMYPAAIGIVVQSFPKEGRGRAMATFFAITGAMTALGPIAGGYLTHWTWRSIFWVNIPVAIVAMILVATAAAPSPRRRERIDWLGVVLVAAGMGLTIIGLQQASDWGWSSIGVWGSILAGVAFLVAFVLVERRVPEPLVRLAAFQDRGFTVSVLARLFASIAFISTFFFLSVYGQVSLGLSAGITGLLFLKFFIGFVVASRFGSRLFDRSGARPVLAIGGVVGAFGFGWLAMAVTNLDVNGNAFFNPQTWPIAIAGAGIGFMYAASSTDAVNRAVGASYGEVTAISETMKNFGGALGLAVFTTIVTTVLTDKVTDAFQKLGATAADATNAVNQITGGSASGSGLSKVPAAVRAQIVDAVQTSYAGAVQWAFFGMAGAMAVLIVLAILYPAARRTSRSASEADADETVHAVA